MYEKSSNLYKKVKDSKLVNPKWYLSTYPDVKKIGMDPIEHFLRYGWRMYRNPCKRFDTKFYMEKYTDEIRQDENPLLHYINKGKKRNYLIRKTRDDSSNKDIKDRIVPHLWGGHSENSVHELTSIIKNNEESSDAYLAAWHLARWYFFIHEYEKALNIVIDVRVKNHEITTQKRFVMVFYFCYLALDMQEDAQREILSYLSSNPLDSDSLLAYSNLVNKKAKLDLINQVYKNKNLIEVIDESNSDELLLSNISTNNQYHLDDERKVSVIMPIYNAEDNIDIAIRGLLNQTWKNIEIIAVDDVSTDNTYEKLVRWSKIDHRVIPIKQDANGGAYKARNTGIKIATGDFITTHDSDDWSHPQKIEKQIEALDGNPKLVGAITYWVRCLQDLTFTQNWRLNSELIHWSHSSFLFKKEVVEKIGSWDQVQVGGDTEFIWRVEKEYGKHAIDKIHKGTPFSFALDDAGSLTRTKITHVKTIHYGLRHIYRETCMWWHSNSDNILKNIEDRDFPAPQRMRKRELNTIDLETLIVGDFSSNVETQKLLTFLAKVDNIASIGLYHTPDYNSVSRSLQDCYFRTLFEGAKPVCAGERFSSNDIVLLNPNMFTKQNLDFYPILCSPTVFKDTSLRELNNQASFKIKLQELA